MDPNTGRPMDAVQPQDAAPRTTNGNGARQASFWKRPTTIVLGSVVLAGLFFLALQYLAKSLTHESTDDAFLDGDVVAIAPKVAGQVKTVYVRQNQPVKAGDPLVDIDPRDYDIQLAQKQSALAAAQANEQVIKSSFEFLGTQVLAAEATARQSEAEAAADQANADRADADLKRAEDLIARQIISPQEYDAAKAAAANANAEATAGREKAASDRSKVDSARSQLEAGRQAFSRAQAQSNQARVDVRQAELNLSYTRLVAPQDGQITRKAVEDGDYLQVGQRLMALVLNDVWVTANFKETQLKRIHVGQPVKITVDSIAGKTFSGRVESIQAGSGAAFSLLPPENAVGNYVKVVQRVPVKIVFDPPLVTDHAVGPGMSVQPSVRVTGFAVPEAVTVIVAILLAAVAGFFWRRLAARAAPAA